MMPIFLTGVAENWFNGLCDEDSNSTDLLVKFKCRFSGLDNVTFRTETYQKCKMQPGEDIEVYIEKLCRLGAQLGKSKEDIVVQAQLGLTDNIKAYVMGVAVTPEPDVDAIQTNYWQRNSDHRGFIECFTTTFLRAHSWLNWVLSSRMTTTTATR